jgi:hypothetical protein
MGVRESPDRSRVIAGVAVLAALALAAGGCHGNPTPSPTPSTAGLQAHRIAVRQAGGGPEFFDTRTGQRFVPRGANFHRLSVEGGAVVDTLFAVGSYDPTWVDGQLAAMTALGYNAVRTAFDLCQHKCIGRGRWGSGPPLPRQHRRLPRTGPQPWPAGVLPVQRPAVGRRLCTEGVGDRERDLRRLHELALLVQDGV